MPTFDTSTGSVKVANWGYQLQGPGGLDATDLANETHDLMVMDFSSDGTGANSFSNAEISQIKDGPGGRSVAAAYLSIGLERPVNFVTTGTRPGPTTGRPMAI